MFCLFTESITGWECQVCGYSLAIQLDEPPHRNCTGPPCRYLAGEVLRSGVGLLVKCTCPKTNGTREQWHPAHQCNAPENKTHRCLPTMKQPFDADHAIEAALYAVCLARPFTSCTGA